MTTSATASTVSIATPATAPRHRRRRTDAPTDDRPLVLIAEDSTTQARWLEGLLRNAGYRVVVASDGPAAIAKARDERPALILADVDMPGMDGFEVCRRVKDDPGLRSIPYVMVTHRDRVTDLVRALEAGADNYLTKPLDEVAVRVRVKRILDEVAIWRERVASRRSRSSFPLEEMMLSLERAQVVEMLMASAQKLEQELDTVSEVGIALTMTHDLSGVLRLLAERVKELSDAAQVTVLLRSDDGIWSVASTLGSSPEIGRNIAAFTRADAAMPFAVEPLSRRERYEIRWDDKELSDTDRVGAERAGIAQTYGWPLVLEGNLIGALSLGYATHKSLTADEDRRFRYLADQAALAVVNARMFEQERSLREALEKALIAEKEAHKHAMFMLAAAVEARDGLTGSHLRRVQAYAEALADRLRLPRDVVDEIGYSSILHDVGKLLVPDEILGKPGKLSDAEWVEMRRHPDHGANILVPDHGANILGDRDFFGMARDIAKCHHERWDGTGYPAGLRGEQIPIAARITSVADVFDALTTRRPYKDPWPDHDALAELRRLSGSSFDPAVIDAFLELYAAGDVARIRALVVDA
ncbi:MAG: response regulator [Candidatus Limnocylindrales bacterium]|nr:response regulator [Candidatus Limnocylindrales bacterium]